MVIFQKQLFEEKNPRFWGIFGVKQRYFPKNKRKIPKNKAGFCFWERFWGIEEMFRTRKVAGMRKKNFKGRCEKRMVEKCMEPETVNNELIQYATYLESVFDAPVDMENDNPIHSLLYDRISRHEYLKPSERKQCIKKFADDLREFYRSMGLFTIASKGQIEKVLQGERLEFSVVCQIAFFLGMIPEELTILS